MNTGTKYLKLKLMRRKSIKKLINRAINKLDKDDYEILYELYFNNASIHQLSKKLGVSRATVRRRRDKAKERMRGIFLCKITKGEE